MLYYDLPARISALRALTSALSSVMSCDSRLGSSIAFSLCGGGFRRRGACRRNLRKSKKPTQGERPPHAGGSLRPPQPLQEVPASTWTRNLHGAALSADLQLGFLVDRGHSGVADAHIAVTLENSLAPGCFITTLPVSEKQR